MQRRPANAHRVSGAAIGFAALAVALSTGGALLAAADWPQFLGPTRNGVYSGPPLAESWPSGGPRLVWRKQVGQGFAGPAVAGNRVILFHRVGREEVVDALDARTGALQWHHAYPTSYRDDFGFDEGPRAVPVVVDNRVYTFGAEGVLSALDLATGKQVWSVDTQRRFNVRKGFFGQAGSPLVDDGRVIANVGGTDGGKSAGIVAFNAGTGAVLWTVTNHEASYSSPVMGTFGGKKLARVLHASGTRSASILRTAPRSSSDRGGRGRRAPSTPPRPSSSTIWFSFRRPTRPARRSCACRAARSTPLWESDDMLSNHYATSIYYDGHLYGFHGRQEFGQALRAVELKTGKVELEPGAVQGGHGAAGRQPAADPARERRARSGGGDTGVVPANRPRADSAGRGPRLSGARGRFSLRPQQRRYARLPRSAKVAPPFSQHCGNRLPPSREALRRTTVAAGGCGNLEFADEC